MKLKNKFVGFLMLSFLLIQCPIIINAKEAQSFDSIKSGIVRISAYTLNGQGDFFSFSQGTGFFINEETIVTAAHVVMFPNSKKESDVTDYVMIQVEDGTYPDEGIGGFGKVVAVDTENDVAIIKAMPMPFEKKELRKNFWNHHSFSFTQNEPTTGSSTRIVGYPDLTKSITITQGLVSTVDNNGAITKFGSDAIVSFGNSGGPMIDSENNVIGIVTSVASSKKINSQFTEIVSAVDMKNWINTKSQEAKKISYTIPTKFYQYSEEILKSVIKKQEKEVSVTVNSSFYPSFNYVLPKGYSASRISPTREYVILNEKKETAVFISQYQTPYQLKKEELSDYITETLIDIDKNSLKPVVFGGLDGVSGIDAGDNRKMLFLIDNNFITTIINLDKNQNVLNSIKFENKNTFKSKSIIDPLSVNDSVYNISFKTPINFVQSEHDNGNHFVVFNKGNLQNRVYVSFNNKFNSFADIIQYEKEDLHIKEDGTSDVYNIVYFKPNENVNGRQACFIKGFTTTNDGDLTLFTNIIWDADRNWAIFIDAAIPGKNVSMSAVEEITKSIKPFIRNTETNTDIVPELEKTDKLQYTDGTQTTPLEFRKKETKQIVVTDTTKKQTDSNNNNTNTSKPIYGNENTKTTNTTNVGSTGSPARTDLRGYVLLQVESKGQAWYIEPVSGERISLSDANAFTTLSKKFAIGISNKNLQKISIGTLPSDKSACTAFSKTMKGKILLQVEDKGQAWYVYPKNCRRYALGKPTDAYILLKKLGLGAKNNDITAIREKQLSQ